MEKFLLIIKASFSQMELLIDKSFSIPRVPMHGAKPMPSIMVMDNCALGLSKVSIDYGASNNFAN
jgi:hypothetical protein